MTEDISISLNVVSVAVVFLASTRRAAITLRRLLIFFRVVLSSLTIVFSDEHAADFGPSFAEAAKSAIITRALSPSIFRGSGDENAGAAGFAGSASGVGGVGFCSFGGETGGGGVSLPCALTSVSTKPMTSPILTVSSFLTVRVN